jgi:predicted membrane channel-forming protein YqfA (hemolysin III family)
MVLLLLCIVLLCAAVGRLLRTSPAHPDRGARRDTVLLLSVLSGAMGLALVRTQFMSTTRLFLALSVALVPLGLIAFWLMVRLVGVYRHEKERPADSTLPDIETIQSRISPPFDGTKQ